jgi:H+/Cl- antiporter ClcA
VFKLIATVLTVAAGFIGGEFLPALVIGTTLGSTLGPLLGLPLSTAAMLGAAGVLSGVSNLPFACIALSLELFGQVAIIPTILVAFTTRSLSGSPSIFDSAKPIDRVSISS